MVIVKFIQDGLKCQLEGETDTYKYSKNMEMQFVKDKNHQDYEVTVFFLDQEKNEGKIDIDENGVFQLGERFFLRKEPFYLSFQLEKGDEIQHLGNYKMRVCDAIGNGSSPLPENPKIWIEYVDEEMDKYFNENFQSKLDKFNADYEEIKKIAGGGGSGSSITVDSELNSTFKNPVQNQAIYKEFSNVNKKIENIPTSFKKINNTEITGDGNIDIPIVNVDAELNETSTNAIQNQAVTKELAEKLSKNGLKTINGESLVGSGNIELSAGDNAYELPIANNEVLGGVMPIAKTAEMSQGVGVDENGRLFTFPGGSGSSEDYRAYKNELIFDDSTNNVSSCVWNLDNIDGFERKGKIFLEIRIETNKNYENAAELNKKAVYLLAFNRHILYHIGTGLSSSYPNWVCGMILEYDVDNNVFEAYMHLSTYGNLDALYGPSQSNNNYHLISVKEELSFTNISLRMDDAVNLVDGINAIKIKIYKLK